MKHTKETPVPATVRVTHSYTCDRCGQPCGDSEATGYNVDQAAIHCETGTNYGSDGKNVDVIEFDCCTECFVKHVVPAMEALGFKARREHESF